MAEGGLGPPAPTAQFDDKTSMRETNTEKNTYVKA